MAPFSQPLLLLLFLVPRPSCCLPAGTSRTSVTTAESSLSDLTEHRSPNPRHVEPLERTDPAGPEARTSWMVQIQLLGLDSGGPGAELYNLFSEAIQKNMNRYFHSGGWVLLHRPPYNHQVPPRVPAQAPAVAPQYLCRLY